MSTYQVTAKNFSQTSENRIHSDEVAHTYGFRGALVPGVAVYGHLVYPLVREFGADWLAQSTNTLRLLKPAYDNDVLSIELSRGANEEDSGTDGEHDQAAGQTVTCQNENGELLATLTCNTAPLLETSSAMQYLDRHCSAEPRRTISWDTIHTEEPFAPWRYAVTQEENARYSGEVQDASPIYREYAHPHLICSIANTTLTREYVMPTWMHVGTETRHHHALKVDDEVAVRAVPTEKWANKGHEFIRVYVSLWRDNQLVTEMLHTAIYKVATVNRVTT